LADHFDQIENHYVVYRWKLLDLTIAIIAVLRLAGNFPYASITHGSSESAMMLGFCEICVISSWLSALTPQFNQWCNSKRSHSSIWNFWLLELTRKQCCLAQEDDATFPFKPIEESFLVLIGCSCHWRCFAWVRDD